MTKFPAGLVVHEDADHLRAFTAPGSTPPVASVQPKSTADIKALVQWANRQGEKLVPVSSASGPRVHGCSVPERSAVIVDLSAMKRIRHIDGLDAIAVIEPGVTFPEFDAQLALHGLRSYKPLLPRRSKSVIGSYLEREPVTSPQDQWDGADPLVSLELVFGNGDKFRTGTASDADELEEQLERGLRQMTSLGPFHTDFTRVVMGAQGTLGIVSWASVYCERLPALESAFFVPSDRLEPLTELASRIAWRKFGAQTFIVNALELALVLGADAEAVGGLAGTLPAWTLFVNVSAPHYFPEERMAYQIDALREDAENLNLKIVSQLAGFQADSITRAQQKLPHVHYKDRFRRAHDEIFFLSHTDRSPTFVERFDRAHRESGTRLPYGVYIQPRVQGSSSHIEFTTFWEDKGPSGEAARTAFHHETSLALADAGAFFSRPYGIWKDIAYSRDAQIVPHLRGVKAMLDPKSVLNPGKFC